MDNFLKYISENQKGLVNSILEGYSEYIDERIEKSKEMLVSNAYAWTKSNHIENSVGKYIKENLNDTMTFQKAKAGFSWIYLKFSNDEMKSLLIIREMGVVKEKSKPKDYLKKLVEINDKDKTIRDQYTQTNLALWSNGEEIEVDELSKDNKFDNFYILTYRIDKDTKDIIEMAVEKPMLDAAGYIFYNSDAHLELQINANNPFLLSETQKQQISDMDDIIGGNVEATVLSSEEYDGIDIKKEKKKINK